jgi:3-oxoacyl-[acyl-carrier protein] reductase
MSDSLFSVQEQVVLVSGGSRGIGRAIAEMLAGEGVRVLIAARTQSHLDEAAGAIDTIAPGHVLAVAADMTDPADVGRIVGIARQHFGPVGIAVSNVIGHVIDPGKEGDGPGAGTFATMDPQEYRREFTSLFVSAWALATSCLPDMRVARWGRICNIGSGVAREPTTDLPHILPNTVRAPVAGLYRVLAHRLAPEGITVNNILTGSISTERNSSYWRWLAGERGQTVDEVTKGVRAGIPLGRMGYPEEMAALVAFLCSRQGAHLTGQSIPVSGGSGAKHL